MKIKVTGYIFPEDGDPKDFDPNHETGLSSEGYESYSNSLMALDDLTFKKEEDE